MSQVKKQILTEGTGLTPPQSANVQVHYTGKFINGQIFDSSVSRGTPFNFVLGAGRVIKGWEIAVASMKQGEKSLFLIPSELAYGSSGVGPIPPNSDLFFEIELLGW